MPSQRLIASNALMCLNGYHSGSSDSAGSDICYTGEDLDQDIDIVTFENDNGPRNYSTSTESRLSSNDTEDAVGLRQSRNSGYRTLNKRTPEAPKGHS